MTTVTAVNTSPHDRRIGLFAGWGRFPVVVAETLHKQGFEVYCLGVKEHADADALRPFCKHFQWNGVSRFGAAIRYFQKHGIVRATMAGKIHKTRLYRPLVWLHYVPDLRTVRMFYRNFVKTQGDRRDDTLLGTIVREFAGEGIDFAPATDFAPELLVKFGQLSRRPPTALERKDVEFGWSLAKEMGRLDIGQSVVIKGRNAIAVEAIEGTDACIRRAGELCRAGKFTIVKVAKPQQDMRFDVPTIGLGTLEEMVKAGASCLAIEAGKTIVIDQDAVARYADKHGLAVIALEAAEQALSEAA